MTSPTPLFYDSPEAGQYRPEHPAAANEWLPDAPEVLLRRLPNGLHQRCTEGSLSGLRLPARRTPKLRHDRLRSSHFENAVRALVLAPPALSRPALAAGSSTSRQHCA